MVWLSVRVSEERNVYESLPGGTVSHLRQALIPKFIQLLKVNWGVGGGGKVSL